MSQLRKVIIYAVFFIAASAALIYGWIFISDLNREYSYAVPVASNTQIYHLTQWQYCWGDSPADSDGSFIWMDTSYQNDDWVDFEFPGRPANADNHRSIWVKGILPQDSLSNAVFRFRTPQNTAEVYLDNKLIYSYGTHDTSKKVRTPGSTWHFVELPPDYQGKTIYIRMSSPFPHLAGYLTQVAVGYRGSLYVDIFLANLLSLIFGSCFILLGLIIALFQIFTLFKRHNDIYLGLGLVCLGGWILAEANFTQLFIFSPVSSMYLANFFIFLVPVWLLIYIGLSYTTRNSFQTKLVYIQAIAHGILAIVSFAFDFAGLISVLYFVKVFHVMLGISLFISVYAAVKSALEGKKRAGVLIIGILALGISGLIDAFTLFYYTSPLQITFKFSHFGMLIFVSVLMINAGRDLKRFYAQIERRSKETETNYKSLFTNMTDGFTLCRMEYAPDGHIKGCFILEANDAFVEKSGLRRKDLIGSDIYSVFPELKALCLMYPGASDTALGVDVSRVVNDAVKLNGRWYRLAIFYPKSDYISIIFSDITVMKNAEETIRRQAYTDSMTGFFNRTFFEEEMSRMNADKDVYKPVSILVIDIDGLKITNDTFGHDSGDELLKKAANIIRSAFRSQGIISRIGGDEFCVLLPNTDNETAQKKMEEIVKITDAVNSSNTPIPISMSVGLATSGGSADDDMYSIYRRADDDMYRYKLSQSSSEKSRVIDMMLTALSERDFVTQGHVERISQLCIKMADALGLHDNQKRNLVLLSKVHDLGKIGIPDEILNKPSKLTAKEYERMKTHVKVGFNIATRSKELVSIAPFILHHHEYWNGKGYPSGLKAEEIPLECRILGIIDAFDAMTNDRPYHKGITIQNAIDEIRRCAGKQFDPVLAENFIEILTKDESTTDTEDELKSKSGISSGKSSRRGSKPDLADHHQESAS